MSRIIALILISTLLGCTSPSFINGKLPMKIYDKDTKYNTLVKQDGFELTILYTRYQFIPESDSVSIACKNQLTSIAWEIADQKGMKIKPVNEQRIKISMGRNGFTGITSCGAKTRVSWDK